jgi:tetratricopeptide (TPR) repeat protein
VADDETEKEPKKLPPRVERALARAREAVKKDAQQKQGRWLAIIPVAIAVIMFLLMMPRPAAPEDIPLPAVDQKAYDAVVASDRARAAAARTNRLPNDVLTVGTAIRATNKAAVANDQEQFAQARAELDAAVRVVLNRQDGVSDLTSLRALHVEEFLAELAAFEASGVVSPALDELAGPLVPRLRDAEWIEGNHVVLDEDERRVSYKLVWNTVTAARGMDPSLDELRILYRLYLTRPHPPEAQRGGLLAERAAARAPSDCDRYANNARRASELWRADKIRMLGALDPAYPTGYALGVAYYRAGRYESAIDAFRAWIDQHPDGKYAARAKNHLKATLVAYGSI